MRSRLALLGLALLVGLGLAEVLAGALDRRGCAGGRVPFWQPHRALGWALIPGAQGEAVVCRGREEIARRHIDINALGQRDRPRDYARSPDRPRVLVLGDSFVEALQVDLEDTFLAKLERRFGFEMVNAGVSGYSTDNELRTFLTRGRRYRPDAVLLVFHTGNDVLENGARLYLQNPHGLPPKPWLRAPRPSGGLASCLVVHRAAAHVADAIPWFLWRGSRLLRAGVTDGVSQVLRSACADTFGPPLVGGPAELFGVYRAPRTPAWEEAWTMTEHLLTKLDARVRASGARFGVVFAPAGLEYDKDMRWALPPPGEPPWDFEYPHRRLGYHLGRAKIPWRSVLSALRAYHVLTSRPGCYEWDGHWDPEGHTIVAEAIADFVRDLVARPATR